MLLTWCTTSSRGDGVPPSSAAHKLIESGARGPVTVPAISAGLPPATPTNNVLYQSETCARPGQTVPRRACGSAGPLMKHATLTPPSQNVHFPPRRGALVP